VTVDERDRRNRLLAAADRAVAHVNRIIDESDAARRRRLVAAVYIDRQRNERGPADG
jgi:hypothetical protein